MADGFFRLTVVIDVLRCSNSNFRPTALERSATGCDAIVILTAQIQTPGRWLFSPKWSTRCIKVLEQQLQFNRVKGERHWLWGYGSNIKTQHNGMYFSLTKSFHIVKNKFVCLFGF